jgi:hypothetical protein
MMKSIKKIVRVKMTESEKRARKEQRRVKAIRELLQSQYSIKGFHRIFTYECDEDGAIREAEVREADRKISELQKQL